MKAISSARACVILSLKSDLPVGAGVRRLWSFSSFEQQIESANSVLIVLQILSKGRGVVAQKDIPAQYPAHSEAPMLTAATSSFNSCCMTCLHPILNDGGMYCSPDCEGLAASEWSAIESQADVRQFMDFCSKTNEKFPLLALRLACTTLQRNLQRHTNEYTSDKKIENRKTLSRGDPLLGLQHLCHANIPSTPPPWEASYDMLMHCLAPAFRAFPSLDKGPLTLCWYVSAMSRFHLNSFRIDTVPTQSITDFSRMSVLLQNLKSSGGTAVYQLASMFNHSCDPNLDITFPHNNAVLVLRARRDIRAGEELTLSYIDAGQDFKSRQEKLQFSYGIECNCTKCQEERMEDYKMGKEINTL